VTPRAGHPVAARYLAMSPCATPRGGRPAARALTSRGRRSGRSFGSKVLPKRYPDRRRGDFPESQPALIARTRSARKSPNLNGDVGEVGFVDHRTGVTCMCIRTNTAPARETTAASRIDEPEGCRDDGDRGCQEPDARPQPWWLSRRSAPRFVRSPRTGRNAAAEFSRAKTGVASRTARLRRPRPESQPRAASR